MMADGETTMFNSRITTEARCDMSIPNTRERKVVVRRILARCFERISCPITVSLYRRLPRHWGCRARR